MLITGELLHLKYICAMTGGEIASQNSNPNGVKPALVDIDQVLADKSPALKKLLPGFVIRYLKRIIHQDELNFYLTEYADLQGVEFIDAVLGYINTKLEMVGLENIPK